ncbi:hypothetical protein [Kitasatospora herbaricolor]|uniref:hypothetical protein n=1 Tax=Kitasatospora herbaricolor TaxID=68217 RepID=UPI0036DD47F7
MPAYTETNVRLPPCALDALAAVAARRGTSRDETVRQLLTKHVEAQEQEPDPDNRRTHISTVLRYPPPPRWRGDPRRDRPLRLRAPADLLERARAVSLTLPGQYERAYRDYQSRRLTDAVMTAIARVEPFTDDFLGSLLPMLRHRAALGLWRLTTAVTSTKPEKALLVEAEAIRTRMAYEEPSGDDLTPAEEHLLLAAEALEEEVAWHAPERFREAVGLARRLLAGPDAETGEQLLYAQGDEWEDLYQDALQAANPFALLEEASGYDWVGRGGTAVWRAHRRVELQDFEDWLIGREDTDTERVMPRPGWLLRTPATWHTHVPVSRGPLPEPYATWVAQSRALAFPHRSGQAVWPLLRRPDGWGPVPGIEPLTRAAADLRPDKMTGFVEATLVDWNHEFEDGPTLPIALEIPADKAQAFGFITTEERHEAMAQAHLATRRRMDDIISDFESHGFEEEILQLLREARHSTPKFRGLARQFDKRIASKFTQARATWRWPGRSAAGELLAGTQANLVACLATQAYRHGRLLLEYSMHEAWQDAFDRYGRRM